MDNKEFQLLMETYKKNIKPINEGTDINEIIPDLVYMAAPWTSDDVSWIADQQWNSLRQVLTAFSKHIKGSKFKNFKLEAEDFAEEEGVR